MINCERACFYCQQDTLLLECSFARSTPELLQLQAGNYTIKTSTELTAVILDSSGEGQRCS